MTADLLLSSFCDNQSQEDLDAIQTYSDEYNALREKAREVYLSGKALEYLINSCQREHIGDELIQKTLFLSYVSSYIENNKGIHVVIEGLSGYGKSDNAKVVISRLPSKDVLIGGFSNQACFYLSKPEIEHTPEGDITHPPKFHSHMVVWIDEQRLNDDTEEALKASTSDWNTPYTKYVTQKKRNGELKVDELFIPSRTPRWFTRAKFVCDRQTANRVLFMRVDESQAHKVESINTIIQSYGKCVDSSSIEEDKAFCRIILEEALKDLVKTDNIGNEVYPRVKVPYYDRISYDVKRICNREIHILFALILASAFIHSPKERETIRVKL